jgi:dipeptidyl aminopeptidase/acylaminoacyl peptidase
VALFAADSGDIWIYDLGRGSLTLFESPGWAGSWPNWSRDGKRLAYQGSAGLFWKPADGTGSAEMLSMFRGIAASWSPQGRLAISHPVGDDGAGALRDWNISVVTPGDPTRTPQPGVHTPAMERYPDFSPDGHWLAYASNQSGRDEVFVQPYPGPGPQHQISINGGTQPRWARNGRELFFTIRDSAASTDFNTIMVVDVETSLVFKAGIPRPLRAAVRLTVPGHGYDVRADGQRFLTVRDTKTASASPPSELIVVLNWVEELKRRLPR